MSSSNNLIIPNFFIAGAAKAGTTSLWMYLKQHPEIFMPVDKEPSFFCDIYGYNNYNQYLQLFKDAAKYKAIGEASHAYLTSPESASWIHREIPYAKIIIVLRNPVERAYSLYRWMVNHGYEWIYPFEKALDAESERKSDLSFRRRNPQYFYNYMYFESGLYFEQISRYYKEFPSEQIKVILLDDLKQKPIETTQSIYTFLNVSNSFVPSIDVHNKAELRPAFIHAHFRLQTLQRRYHNRRIAKFAAYLFRKNMRLGNINWPKMNAGTRRVLVSKFSNDINKTGKLINREMSSWLLI